MTCSGDEQTDRELHGFVQSPISNVSFGDRGWVALFDSAFDPIAVVDDAACVVEVNPAACALFGVSKTAFVGRQYADFLTEKSTFAATWQRFLQQGQQQGVHQVTLANGQVQMVQYHATAQIAPHHHLLRWRTVGNSTVAADLPREQDGERSPHQWQQAVQHYQQTVHRLQQRNADLQGMLSDLDDIIWSSAPDGTATYFVSAAVEPICGYPPAAFVEKPRLWFDLVHPDDRDRVGAAVAELPIVLRQDLNYRIVRADGEVRWVRDRWRLIHDASGQPVRIDGITTDITDQQRTKTILTRRHAELQSLHRISEIVLSEPSLEMAFARIVKIISAVSGFPIVAIELYDAPRQQMVFVGATGIPLPESGNLDVPVEQTLSGKVAQTARPIVKVYQPQEGKPCDHNEVLQRLGITTFVCLPMPADPTHSQPTLGTLSFAHVAAVVVDRPFLDWGTSLANYIASLIKRKHIEADRLKRDEMVRKIATQIPGMIYQFRYYPDGHSCFPYVSETICQVYEVTPEQVRDTADPVLAVLHPDDRDRVMESIQESFVTMNLWRSQYRVLLPKRGERWLEGHARPEKMPDGSVLWHGYIWDITEQKQVEQEIRQQAERERLLITITQHIRQSLDLYTILSTTVQEVRSVLKCDRALFFRLHANGIGIVERESLAPGCSSLSYETYRINCFPACYPDQCNQAAHYCTEDTQRIHPEDCPLGYLLGQSAKAQLIVPILHQHTMWGLLVVHQCDRPRRWQTWEIQLLSAIANQVSIAIHQSHLYRQVQQFNLRLEQQVQERTEELRQSLLFEALLKRITDRVRDSLNQDQIFQAAVQELAAGLGVVCCDAGFYSEDYTTCTITHERTQPHLAAQGTVLSVAENLDIHAQLFCGKTVYACLLEPNPVRQQVARFTIFACPLMDDQRVLGNLWLFKPMGELFNDLEMRLVQQVANQCAIALRQSRLYEASQTQVEELARLNRLKDDFLNTVSHELRTPMSNIKMATQMLAVLLQQVGILTGDAASDSSDVPPEYERVAQYFQILNNECQRETNLINDLLDLSRLEAEADPIMWLTLRLQDWIPAIAEPFDYKTQLRHQHLHLDVPPDLPALTTDLQYLERIVVELLENACKYTPEGEQITVTVRLIAAESPAASAIAGSEAAPTVPTVWGTGAIVPPPKLPSTVPGLRPPSVTITVSNTGVEIPAQELTHVFDKFYRVPSQDPWKHGGTGLGLALTQKLVERLHGAIAVASEGGETRFIVTLPLSPPSP